MSAGLVVPLFRGPTRIDAPARALFARGLSDDAFAAALATTGPAFRVNVARVLAAAALARREERTLALVEGWRANAVPGRGGRVRLVPGSWVAALILRLVVRRGLVPAGPRAARATLSRCTLEEVQGARGLCGDGDLVLVAGTACPSARRAARYAGTPPACTALTPAQALARAGGGARAAAVLRAAALGPAETLAALALEAAAWGTHLLSAAEARLLAAPRPLEQRLAHRLRPDG
jgi:hypothetical protein